VQNKKLKYLNCWDQLMNRKLKPYLIVGAFWFALFFFVIAGYSGALGPNIITGFAVAEPVTTDQGMAFSLQSLAILILLFTNIVTLFFLIREHAGK
jgi:hypothetical protein